MPLCPASKSRVGVVLGLSGWLGLHGLACAAEPPGSAGPQGSPPVLASTLAVDPVDARLDASPAEPAAAIGQSRLATDATPTPIRWSSTAELVGNSYRWSLSRGSLDFGLRFDVPANGQRSFDARPDLPGPIVSTWPSVSVGVRHGAGQSWRGTLLDRAMAASAGDTYVSKVGVEWKPAESRMNFLRDGLGIRLEGNDRMTVRLRKGVLGIYLHRKF